MNTNSNVYTVVYAAVLVGVVAAGLAITALALKPAQVRNVEVDKKMQILASIKEESTANNAEELYDKFITKGYILDSENNIVSEDLKAAFAVELTKELLKPVAERQLPIYESTTENGVKYIIPVRGKGLWGPIWGYVALNSDGNTIFGVNFSHKGETPGLGAEITTNKFSDEFNNKQLYKNGEFASIAVLKSGMKAEGKDAVDAISGGTITSKGLENMLSDCLVLYDNFLKTKQIALPMETAEETAIPF